mgnify:CR=1 FL=1
MTEKSFVMVSLKEDKAKKLTQALSNEKCRKILDYLSNRKEATETQIAKELKLPISTVHYNLKILAENKLVTSDEFHYSEKGKEVIHYKIANKYIIIAPNEDESFLERLKSFIPAFIITSVTAACLFIYQMLTKTSSNVIMAARGVADANTKTMIMEEEATTGMMMATREAMDPAPAVQQVTQSSPDIALWFFIGAIFTMLIFLLWEIYKSNKKN